MYSCIGNKHFFTKSYYSQTYQDYEKSLQKLGTFLEKNALKIKTKKKVLVTVGLLFKEVFRGKIRPIFNVKKGLHGFIGFQKILKGIYYLGISRHDIMVDRITRGIGLDKLIGFGIPYVPKCTPVCIKCYTLLNQI